MRLNIFDQKQPEGNATLFGPVTTSPCRTLQLAVSTFNFVDVKIGVHNPSVISKQVINKLLQIEYSKKNFSLPVQFSNQQPTY